MKNNVCSPPPSSSASFTSALRFQYINTTRHHCHTALHSSPRDEEKFSHTQSRRSLVECKKSSFPPFSFQFSRPILGNLSIRCYITFPHSLLSPPPLSPTNWLLLLQATGNFGERAKVANFAAVESLQPLAAAAQSSENLSEKFCLEIPSVVSWWYQSLFPTQTTVHVKHENDSKKQCELDFMRKNSNYLYYRNRTGVGMAFVLLLSLLCFYGYS